MYKFTDVTLDKARWPKDDKKENSKTFTLPKTVDDLNIHKVKIDTCVIVTTNSVYKLIVRYVIQNCCYNFLYMYPFFLLKL